MTAISIPISTYPWQPESNKTGLRAIGDIGVGLMNSLKTARGIHSETLLTVIGALAGFAAQNAALNGITSGAAFARKPHSLAIVSAIPGEIFLFGDAINGFLFSEEGSVLPLAALVFGAAVKAGVAEANLPNLGEMAACVASAVGSGADFGKLRERPGVMPHLQPLAALSRFWPKTRNVLSRPPVKPLFGQRESPLQEIHWPIVLGLVASQFIAMTKQSLNPSIGAAIVMESAIITSKIDPQQLEPGKWRIDASDGKKAVVRLR